MCFFVFSRRRFLRFFFKSSEHPKLQKTCPKRVPARLFEDFYAAFWEPLGHLWETFGDQGGPKVSKSVPKATQWLQGSQKGIRKDDMTRLSQ